MKHKRIVGAILAVAVAGTVGILTGSGSSSAQDAVHRGPSTSELTLRPGAVGPVTVGMSKTDALKTGFFDADLPAPAEGCFPVPLAWKGSFTPEFDVQTLTNGTIVSIGVNRPGPTTDSGLGVGSTYADVLAVIPGAKAIAAGYGQSGVAQYDEATDGWIGYLFDAAPADLAAADQVTFVELTRGLRPGLIRDGC